MPVKDGQTILALPKEQGGYADDPILGVVENMHLGSLQHPAEIYVGILAATILFIATNAGIIGVSRLSYSMGQHRQLPELLRTLHPKFRTPYVAIMLFGRSPASRSCRARPTSSASSTPSARCCRSRWRTSPYAPALHQAGRRAALARPRQRPLPRRRRAPLRRLRRPRHRRRAGRRDRARPARAGLRGALAHARLRDLRRLPQTPGAVADPDRQDRHAQARRRARGGVPVGAGRLRGGHLLERGGRDGGAAGRPAPARHPRAGDDHRAAQTRRSTPPCRSRRPPRSRSSTRRACAAGGA